MALGATVYFRRQYILEDVTDQTKKLHNIFNCRLYYYYIIFIIILHLFYIIMHYCIIIALEYSQTQTCVLHSG